MPSGKKITAALSGGVDSATAAAIYLKKGYDVNALTLRMLPEQEFCDIEERAAAEVAAKLGIPHRVLDVREEFKEKILKNCWKSYMSGKTPNPCVICNRDIKFGILLKHALATGSEAIITGHYIKKIKLPDGNTALKRGADPAKDQTYFLFALNRWQIEKIFFPLGAMLKPEVKKYAKKLGMKKTAGKKESQDACFAQQGECFSETLRKLFNGGITEGNFITPSGQIIAPHKGIHNYTTGQRKGLGIALGEPAFISKIDPETGDITVTVEQAELYSLRTTVADINWQQPDFAGQHFKCEVQIRYRNKPVRAEIIPAGTDRAEVLFEEPKRAVTPGQGAAFYKDNILLGGGWIEKTG